MVHTCVYHIVIQYSIDLFLLLFNMTIIWYLSTVIKFSLKLCILFFGFVKVADRVFLQALFTVEPVIIKCIAVSDSFYTNRHSTSFYTNIDT